MSRTEEAFAAVWNDVKWFVEFHDKPVWLVPVEDGYRISVIKPRPDALPYGTTSNLYDVEMNIIDSVPSSKSWME